MPTRRFRSDIDPDLIVSELDQCRARGVAAGNHAAIYDRLYDALPAAEREATLAPVRQMIANLTEGSGRGARRWLTRHQQDLIDYNRYAVVRALRLADVPWTELAEAAERRLGDSGRAVMASYSRVRKALRAGGDGRYYFSRHLVVASDDNPDGLYVLPDPDLLNALPRL